MIQVVALMMIVILTTRNAADGSDQRTKATI